MARDVHPFHQGTSKAETRLDREKDDQMSTTQGQYGIADIEYNLVTTLSNLLQGQEVLEKYAKDADQAGDSECATLFRTIRENNRNSAQQVRAALGRHISGGQ